MVQRLARVDGSRRGMAGLEVVRQRGGNAIPMVPVLGFGREKNTNVDDHA